ncbi:MAG: NAD(P)-binding domain-containing protein [Rubricoccaceae bacterium]|nr:NAD(P)-binding domain-containing protein [Rubricoccaceae bacterium]
MHIAIIGSGSVGGALGRAFAGLGHTITFGVRDPDRADVRALADATGASLAAPAGAVRDAALVVLSVPGAAAVEIARGLGDLSGKVLLDTTNPVGPSLLPTPDAEGRSLAERIAAAAPGARVVKGFHTLAAQHMGDGRFGGQRTALFLSGDDADAKATVADLAERLGFEAVDTGGLDRARLTEPLALLWITLAARQGWGRGFAFALARDEAG